MNDQTERHMHTESWVPATTKLVVDLIGPFVVHFVNGIARVHAPFCEDHHANILTDTNDIPLDGLMAPPPFDGYQPPGYMYHFKNGTGPSGRRGRCGSYYPEKLLFLNMTMKPVESNTCHLTFELPNPDMIVPLLPEQIFIQRNGATAWFNQP